MTLLETLVSLAVASGVIVGALEASRLAASRAATAFLDVEAAARAERLHSRVGTDLPLEAGHREGSEGGGIRWSLDVKPYSEGGKGPKAFEIAAVVSITRGGLSAKQTVATLKLEPGPSR
jgi:hypothetical protein